MPARRAGSTGHHRSSYSDSAHQAEISPDPIYAAVVTLDHELTVEIGYRVPWDEEHTLGARLRQGRLVELCGSVLEP
jgi:hypothetical protein